MMTSGDGSDNLHVGSSVVFTFVIIKLKCTWECSRVLSLSECNCVKQRAVHCVLSTTKAWEDIPAQWPLEIQGLGFCFTMTAGTVLR
jgi:hypothetical protein